MSVSTAASSWQRSRADRYVREVRATVQPNAMVGREVFHYSIPVIQELGDGRVESGDDIDSAKTRIDRPVLLVSKLNPRKSTVIIAEPKEFLTVCSGEFVPLEAHGCDLRYLFYVFLAEEIRQHLAGAVQSVTRSHQRVNPAMIRKVWWSWPPLEEQRAIAAFLDRETAKIDELIAKKQRLIELLAQKKAAATERLILGREVARQASTSYWFGRHPADWQVRPLKFALEFLNNRRIPLSALERADMDRSYPYYGASGIIDHVDNYIFDEPLILVAEDGANLYSRSTALAFVATGKYWVNNHAHILRPRIGPIAYWEALLQLIQYDPWISGSAQPKLTKENLGSIPLPIAPMSDMASMVARLAELNATISPTELHITQAIDRLRQLRSALISAAVTGQIDIRGD